MAAPAWRLVVEKVRRLAVPSGREALGEFALEGHRSMERALRNNAPLLEALVSESFSRSNLQREQEILEELSAQKIPVQIAPDEVVQELTGGRRIGDVFGVLPIPESPALEDLLSGEGRRLVLVGWNLADPGNTGAIIRSALAVGASGFLAVGTTDPWHPKSVRTSMGSLFKLPILRVKEEDAWMEELQKQGVESFASVCRSGELLPDMRPSADRMALLLGSEAFGLSEEIAQAADRRLVIPMPEGVDSFSVNAAAAVLSYTLLHTG